MIDPSKPVRLRRAPEMRGRITSVGPTSVAIAFDGGGTGRFDVEEVEQAPQDKDWPPAGLETKTPHTEVK